ncbi:MAG: Signal transduction histidine kinase CheA [Candidatus Ozemobacter sibiricus]|uniref:Signal transduction histidine kinase CheA n=1 Tax=Candidatus Ozemobacter sibiricus TaxID=2268124 RepID=A0A367ZKC8_9BACT|nr:MAG: Signal transduction histidine kinase CheA [Candidatus Ozemobacter sibiricus]
MFAGTIALIGYQIGTPSLFETSEGRFASIARAMVDTGDWLIPRFNGLVHLSKPPLPYWASALGQKLLGFDETGARALLPVAAAITAWGCFRIGLLLMPLRAALISTFILLTSLFFNAQFRGLTADPFLAMFETWMVWALIAFVQNPRPGPGVLFYAMAGAAMLTKGPPGLLPLLGLLPGLGLRYGWARLRRLAAMPTGWLIFLVLGLGWYLLMGIRFPGAISYFLYDETLARVASTSHQRGGPWYYFIGILLGGSIPWTLFFVAGLIALLGEIRDERQPMNLPLLLWLAAPFVVFSLSQSKLPAYALPLMVPLSLICGRYLAPMLHLNEDEPLTFKLESSVTLFFLGASAVATLYCAWSGIVPDPRFAKVVLFLGFYLVFLTAFGYLFLSWEMAKGILLVLGFIVPGSMMFLLPGLRGDEEIAPGRFLPGYRALLQDVEALPEKATIISIEDMLHAAYFYTGKVIPTWNVTRETRFDPDLARLYDLHGDQALRDAASGGAFLLIRAKDVPTAEPIVGRRLERITAVGPWGLYHTGPVLATWRPLAGAPLPFSPGLANDAAATEAPPVLSPTGKPLPATEAGEGALGQGNRVLPAVWASPPLAIAATGSVSPAAPVAPPLVSSPPPIPAASAVPATPAASAPPPPPPAPISASPAPVSLASPPSHSLASPAVVVASIPALAMPATPPSHLLPPAQADSSPSGLAPLPVASPSLPAPSASPTAVFPAAARPADKPAAKPAPKPTPKPAARPAPKPPAKPASKPPAKSSPKPAHAAPPKPSGPSPDKSTGLFTPKPPVVSPPEPSSALVRPAAGHPAR